jgi:hypothetical protein
MDSPKIFHLRERPLPQFRNYQREEAVSRNTENRKGRGYKRERITINVCPGDVEEFGISITIMAKNPLCDGCLTPPIQRDVT